MKTKIQFHLLFAITLISVSFFATQIAQAQTRYSYNMLESLPGFYQAGAEMTNLPNLILSIYKFGIWIVGITGLFMLVIGGIMYMISAGNNASINNAKDIIWDSIFGVIAALCAYLFLYIINPDFTQINLDSIVPVQVYEIGPGPSTSGAGNCNFITDSNNPCSVDRLKAFGQSKGLNGSALDDWATKASSICNAESSGKANAESQGRCSGTPIALGLFQINLSSNFNGVFDKAWDPHRADSTKNDTGCKPTALYASYRANAFNVNWNLNQMWDLYQKRRWQPWEVTLNGMCPKWSS